MGTFQRAAGHCASGNPRKKRLRNSAVRRLGGPVRNKVAVLRAPLLVIVVVGIPVAGAPLLLFTQGREFSLNLLLFVLG